MTMGLACDRDGYDLRITPCPRCGSRGCPNGFRCSAGGAKLKRFIEQIRNGNALAVPNRLFGSYVNEDGDAT